MSLTFQQNDTYTDFTKIAVGDLGCGFQIVDATSGKFFALVSSNAAVDHVSVESVLGRPDLRWQFTGQTAGIPIGSANWLQLSKLWVSTLGNDGNDGKGETSALLSIKTGLQKLAALGGGTLYLDDGLAADPSNANHGIWVRGDTFAVPGFVNIPSVPIRIVGTGKTAGIGPFLSGPQSKFTGGGSRHAPNLWVVGPLNAPFRVEYMQHANAHQVGGRVGVDYDRNLDGSERAISISSATRTGTVTTYTTTLPPGLSVVSAERGTFNTIPHTTHLVITNPGLPWPPFKNGSVIRLVSTDTDFPSGDYTIAATSATLGVIPFPATWDVFYVDGSSTDKPPASMAGSTMATHGGCPADFIDLTVTTGDFLGTQYEIVSVTAATITVNDVFGHGNATTANIGTLTRQERYQGGTNLFEAYKCGFACDNTDPLAGPAWDIGHTNAIEPNLDSCYMGGFVGSGATSPRDEERMAACFVSAGVSSGVGASPAASGVTGRHCSANGGAIYVKSITGTGSVDVRDHVAETTFQALGIPALHVVGNVFTTVFGSDIENADTANATVILEGVYPTGAWLERCGTVVGSCIGGDSFQFPSEWQGATGTAIQNPWTQGQATYWADLRFSAKHPGAARAMGVVGARFANIIPPPSAWSGNTITQTGFEAPDGSFTAFQLVSTVSAYTQLKASGVDGAIWAAGGYFIFCGWINAISSNFFSSTDGVRVFTSDFTFGPHQGASQSLVFPYFGQGWQFVQMSVPIASVATSTPIYTLDMFMPASATLQGWGWTAHYVPNTFHVNDIAEYMGTLKHQPFYLRKGMSGTMEGGKLIAHGGLGIDTSVPKVAGVGSGQLTVGAITTYEPRYAADGVTIIGWAPLFAATVNP